MANDDVLNELLDEQESATPKTLAELSAIADAMQQRKGEVDRLEDKLKQAKEELRKIQEEVLPTAMQDANVPLFVFGDKTIKLAEKYYCSVPAKRKGEIIAALREDGYSDMISNVLTVEIDKGKDNAAAALAETAAEMGFEPVRAEDVNTGSLKALLKRRVDDGEDIDLSFYGAHRRMIAEVK